ncbi:MAG TPA: response regulator transcription factor [Propionibacteriaceae bacterium]|nr:response regulator transcription factor [Propionibacteriaceae bacterium]
MRRPGRDDVMPAAAPRPIRVFVLDDHEIVRRGLRDLLESEPDIQVVGESGSAVQSIPLLTALRPDVAILDVRLLDGNGIEVCRSVRSIDGRIRSIILTTYDDDDALFAAIMAGASGFVLKQVRGTDLVGSIRRVAAGESLLDPAVAARVQERLRSSAKRVGNLGRLSDREYEVLRLVADGLTNRQIAERLYIAEKTVKNHVSSILGKLGLERRTQAAALAAKMAQRGIPR